MMPQIEDQLRAELDMWAAAGLRAKVWWRDDDAVSDTPALRRLLDIARAARISIALAVVPEHADTSLVELVGTATCCIWQHGWGHHFHTAGEFGDDRPLGLLLDEALAGQRSLGRLIGSVRWQ